MRNQDTISVTRAFLPPFSEYTKEIESLWDSHWITNMGVKHHELESRLKEYLDTKYISLYANGHSALEGIMETLELGKYDERREVITTPFTFASTTHAIVRKNLVPVFADIKESDYTLDPKSIEELITDKTCAILPVHVYGMPCDVDAIKQLADKHNIKVIYDAAHAFGVKRNGESIVNYGDASILSFHATKVFNSIEGGAICFSDPTLCAPLDQWKNFGITGPESVEYVGGNAKMNEFSAAMGICNLRHIDEIIEQRKRAYDLYCDLLGCEGGLKLLSIPENVQSNYSYMPILLNEDYPYSRDELYSLLASNNIRSRKYFYPLVPDYSCYEDRFVSSTPIAHNVAENILTLPLYPELSDEDIERICELIRTA